MTDIVDNSGCSILFSEEYIPGESLALLKLIVKGKDNIENNQSL